MPRICQYGLPVTHMVASKRRPLRAIVAIACASIGITVPGIAFSQDLAEMAATAPATLHEATARAIERLPDTAAYQALRDQVAVQLRAARGPFVGPPVVRGDILSSSAGLIEQEASVSASIRWPGEGRAQRLAADRGGAVVDASLDEARLLLAGEVRTAWWALASALAVVAVEREQIASADLELAQVGRLVSAGEQSQRDLLIARGERGAVQARLLAAEAQLISTQAAYETLAGSPPEQFSPEAATQPTSIDEHPVVRATMARAAAAEARAGALRYSSRPRVQGSVGVRRERIDARGDYANALTLGVAVPLGRNPTALADMAGARAEAIRATAEATRVRSRLIADRAAAGRRIEIADRALSEAQKRRDALAQALELTARGRREGEIGYIEFLRARQSLAAAERDLAIARVAAFAAISTFNQSQGVLP